MRKGIAPVVATIILVLIVVVTAGGAFAWFDRIIEDQQQEGEDVLDREVAVRAMECSSGTQDVGYLFANTGTADLTTTGVNVYVYNVSSGGVWGINASWTLGDGTLETGSQMGSITRGESSITFSGVTFQGGDVYDIQFEFTDEDGYVVSNECRAG